MMVPPTTASASLTEQQRRAVTTRAVSVVLSSGAGCGKTHVLTERYLSHLRTDGAEVGQIVAITFTDRAARQMRQRIRRAVVAHLRAAPGDDEAETWARHLRALESAPISTIHAFCGTLLRQHAIEAGLDPRFDVLEEVLAVNLEADASAACLQRLLTSPTPVGEDLRQLILLYGWRGVGEGVGHLLQAHDERPWQEWLLAPAERIVAAWTAYARDVLLPRYIAHLFQSRPAIARLLPLLRRHPPQPGPMVENVELLLRELPRLAEAADLGAAVKALTEAAKVGRVGVKAWPDPVVYEHIKTAFEDFREDLRDQQLERFVPPAAGLEQAVEVGKRLLNVTGAVRSAYQEAKHRHGVVDFQDLLVLARDLLRDRPEVRARLQDRYRFLLIDELQDTDPVQMELVEYLCGGGLTAGQLFAVGDHSQSIYRFRGADVSLFQALRRRMPHDGRQGLTVNFRSQPALLDFTNALLGKHLLDYEPLRPHEPQVNPGPCIELLWAPRPNNVSVAEARSIEAEWIAQRIAGMIGREQLVVEREGPENKGKLRPVRAGDVVLLFRAMSNVHLYESALRRYGLEYYLVGGRAFFAQQEIYDILNLLRALENPQDSVSLTGALRSPFCCVSDEAMFVLGRHEGGMWAGLRDPAVEALLPADQLAAVRRARAHLLRWRASKDRLPIALLLGEVFADSGYDATTQFEFLGDRKLANLWKLVDLARTFDRSGLFGLAEFIARLGDLVKKQPREEQAATQPESADVVRLMSIHQAKGLEFPIVFVPDVAAMGGSSSWPVAEWGADLGCVARSPAEEDAPPFIDFAYRLWQANTDLEEWHEDLRTLYVACTRARDYLVLSAAMPANYHPSGPWMLTLAERFDFVSGQCRAEDVAPEHRPAVRVYGSERPPPAPAKTVVRTDVEGPGPAPELPVAPPPRRGARAVSVERLEEWLAGQGPLGENEDEAGQRLALSAVERAVRAVLGRWDFREPDGWRPLLGALYPSVGPLTHSAEQREAARLLERLAGSELRQKLARATLRRDVEFVLTLKEGPPAVHGRIETLWQDEKGRWHLLFTSCEPIAPEARAEYWQRRQPGLVLAAAAVQRQSGAWPLSVTLAFLHDGSTLTKAGGRLPHRSVLAAVEEALGEMARQVVASS
jgi:ATP-dependent helicase/nuclease subunit A